MSTSEKNQENYLVLARKYRPQNFAELKGQDALVRTLTNAINSSRIHHAYVLTGIRGVGKTTTARIIAKALNCENGPSISWDENDPQVNAISIGNHVDVLEFDAASNTGVDDIKDLFEGVAYAPIQGRYKVYIVDEVHMLSKQAFNALLKTLEEPPEHVKFIFATTEVNKIPVTVLSRCQRFDLRRVSAVTLVEHFNEILAKEKIKADEAAITMIARAADGSVRDGLSLLDQAIALSDGGKITSESVGQMLGLADRQKVFDLFEHIMAGDAEAMIAQFQAIYDLGFDPMLLLADLQGLVHLLTRLKIVAGLKDSNELAEIEKTRGVPLAEKIALDNLNRVYQMLLHATAEAKQADRPGEVVEMALIRVCHLAALPPIADLLKQAQNSESETPPEKKPLVEPKIEAPVVKAVTKPTEPAPWEGDDHFEAPAKIAEPVVETIAAAPLNWEILVKQIRETAPALGSMLSQQVSVEQFAEGDLTLHIANGLHEPKEIILQLRTALKQLTNRDWQVQQAEQKNSETLRETNTRKATERVEAAKQHKDVQTILQTFPGAEVVEVQEVN